MTPSLRFLLLGGFFLLSCVAHSQNIGLDLQRVIRLAPVAREIGEPIDNPALDTIVLTLAYYGGMPDAEQVDLLLSGPELLNHYRNNADVRAFLLNERLDKLLEDYTPPSGLAFPPTIATEGRASFLQELPGSELFSRGHKVDLGKIRQTFTSPPSTEFNLKAAAEGANNEPIGLSSANLVGNALAGLSDWISRRAQEELTYTFLTKLREDINRNKLEHLFPETSNFLPTLDLLNYKAILPSIRKAFIEDLNAIAFNLGNFLEAQDVAGFRNPVVYNVFLVYRILDLEMREVPLADILAFTYGELERARIDTRCQIDLRMAKVDTTTPAYQEILLAFDDYIRTTENLNTQFAAAENLLSSQFFNPILDAVETGDLPEDVRQEFFQRAAELFLPLDAEKLPLKNNYWEVKPDPPATGIVRAWLRGQEAYEYYEAYPSLTRFDELFGPEALPFDQIERRAAGLTAVRELLAQRRDLEAYAAQIERLVNARAAFIDLRQEVSNHEEATKLAELSSADKLKILLENIDAELAYTPAPEQPALRLLRKIAEEIIPGQSNADKQIDATRQRLADWVMARGDSGSPFLEKMKKGPIEASNLPPLQAAIDATEEAYDQLHGAVQRYSSSRADSLVRTYQNLTTFETVFGMAQQVFFLLSDSDSDLFIDKGDMAIFQTNPSARHLLAGLSQERIARVPNLGPLNAPGIADFLLDFGLYLSDFRALPEDKQLAGFPEGTVRRIQAVAFITNTLESILTAELLQDPSSEGGAFTLTDQFPAFEKVPEVSHELNEIFRLSQIGEYRYAVDNLLNLLRLFDILPAASKKQERLEAQRNDLRKLIDNHVIEKNEALRAVALATPSSEDLPMLGDERDEKRLQLYSSQLLSETDPLNREEIANSIRDLKIRRIREELILVEKRIAKLNPSRVDQFRENLFRYGTFMADVANAESPAEFENALNTVALPAGSSQIKRNRPSSVELGAYFGVALSRERLVLPVDVNDAELEEAVFGASLFVPVGFSYSRNIGGRKSLTFFGSLLDLGALTAFRLESREEAPGSARVDRLPEFRPANVIAPGLHILYNFPKSPFSLGIGAQDGPSVRQFTAEGSTVVREARSVRGMVSFSVDVPIFRFFNK